MPNHSHAEIIGHAGRDAETRYLPTGDAVTEVSVAVTRKRKNIETVTWWKIAVFGKPTEWAGKIAKGDVVHASGEPVLEEWTDKARSLGVFQAFAEIVMPLEREYEADISEPLAAALAAVGAPLKEVVPFDDLDREMGWDKPDAADRLDTPAMET